MSFSRRLVFARTLALHLVLACGLSVSSCCRLFPGSATAATEDAEYQPGDTVRVALLNRTEEARRAPSPGERSSLERYSSGRWLPVRLQDPSLEPFLMPGEEIQAILPVEKSVPSCSEAEFHFTLPRSLLPGRYRIRIPESWVTNSFLVGLARD